MLPSVARHAAGRGHHCERVRCTPSGSPFTRDKDDAQSLSCDAPLRRRSRVNALSRGPNAGSICDHSTGSDNDPRRSRTPNVRGVDNSESYGISIDASIRRHPCRKSSEHSDGHTHRIAHRCARRRLLDKGPQKPRMHRQRAPWLWKLLTCSISPQPFSHLATQRRTILL